jgi:hypothetical protein
VLVAVTDHAAERFRQRVGGTLDAKLEIIRRVAAAVEAGRTTTEPPPGSSGARGSLYVTDLVDRSLVFVCRQGAGELVVVTLWEHERGVAQPRVPRRFTDALEHRKRRRGRSE